MKDQLKQQLEKSLPPLVPRHDIMKKYGIPYKSGYLANLDCLGKGPGSIRIGRKICYERSALINWLLQRVE